MRDALAVAVALSTPLLREGIVLLLDDASMDVIEVAPDASDLQRADSAAVALVEFDGSASACAQLAALRRQAPDLRIVALHDGQPPRLLDHARAVGASVLVDITAGTATLLAAIRGDHDRTLRRWDPPRVGVAPLDPRERDVLSLIARGASSREAAERLSIKPHTVERVMQDLLRKLDASNQAQAVAIALRDGLLHDDSDEGASA